MINFEENFIKKHLIHIILFLYVGKFTAIAAYDRINEVCGENQITSVLSISGTGDLNRKFFTRKNVWEDL